VEGDHMTFAKNPKYFKAGKPAIDEVIVRIVPDDTVRKTMMQNGDADIDMWINVNTINDLKDSEVARVSLSPTDRWVVRLFMNEASKGETDPLASPHLILSDVRVRQAIRMAVDVDTINNQIFYGLAHPVWTEFFRPPYVCDVPRPKFDPEAAKALLEQAGWTDSDGDGIRECNGCSSAEPGHKQEAMTPGNGWNFFRWNNPAVDALIDETYTLDEQKRKDTFCAIGDYINQEVPNPARNGLRVRLPCPWLLGQADHPRTHPAQRDRCCHR